MRLLSLMRSCDHANIHKRSISNKFSRSNHLHQSRYKWGDQLRSHRPDQYRLHQYDAVGERRRPRDCTGRLMVVASNNRTVYVPPPWQPKLVWPTSEPDDVLDYVLDMTAALADVGDTLTSVTAAVAPSGVGELTPSQLSFSEGVITLWLSNGVAGRLYVIEINAFTTDSREFSFYVELPISLDTAIVPSPPPPSPGFGTPISS